MAIEYTAPISNKENPALKVTKFEPMIGWDPSTRIVNKVDLNTIDQAITRLEKIKSHVQNCDCFDVVTCQTISCQEWTKGTGNCNWQKCQSAKECIDYIEFGTYAGTDMDKPISVPGKWTPTTAKGGTSPKPEYEISKTPTGSSTPFRRKAYTCQEMSCQFITCQTIICQSGLLCQTCQSCERCQVCESCESECLCQTCQICQDKTIPHNDCQKKYCQDCQTCQNLICENVKCQAYFTDGKDLPN